MTIHARDEGEGSPLVLLHGLGASSRVFDPLFERRGERRVIAVDLPRSGRSGHWAPSTPAAIADELVRHLDRAGVERFELFGHSFGGLVSLATAAKHGERIDRLTVASSPALGVPPELRLLLGNPMADLTMAWFGKLPVWRPALKSYLQLIWGESSKIAAHHLELYEEAMAAPGFSLAMLEALRSVGEFRLPADLLRQHAFDKRILWGAKDRLVSVVEGERLARAIGADFHVLDDIGHCVPEEHPEGLVAHLLREGAGK